MNVEENQILSQARGSLGLSTLQEKVQGIPPAFLKPLMKKNVFENDTLTFYAEVFGLPSPQVNWFRNKTQLVADDRVTIERDGDSISLTIQNVTRADQGEYICEAVNYVGEARSVAVFQVTETPPKCIIPLTDVTAAVGTPVILQCLVNGKPNPTAEWYKDGDRITDSRYIIQVKTAGHFNLLITNVTQSDAGEYKCIIQNTAGCIETAALLKVCTASLIVTGKIPKGPHLNYRYAYMCLRERELYTNTVLYCELSRSSVEGMLSL
uniref:Ig-like domain-containing protein n=1 Tax=Pundamilia nyererei TaxID=303518 RepID=A0A3B4G811_9CICH